MFNVQSLRSQSAPVKPLGTIPWLLTTDPHLNGTAIGLDSDGFVDWEGTGYYLCDLPLYPLSSSQRQVWESGNQQILAMLVEASGGTELLEEAKEDSDGNAIATDLTQAAKVSLIGAMAIHGAAIRSIQSQMIECVLRVPVGSSGLLSRVSGIGSTDTDLFVECFQAATELLAPKKKEVDPNDSSPTKKRSR